MAACLRVSEFAVYRLIGKGELHPFRLGREWRVNRDDTDDFVKRRDEFLGHVHILYPCIVCDDRLCESPLQCCEQCAKRAAAEATRIRSRFVH